MKRALLTIAILAGLTGCATNDYALYADTQKAIAQSRAISDAARYNALAEIAKHGDSAAKVAAVMSIQLGSGSTNSQPQQSIAPPKSFGETALQWTSVLLPSITQVYGISQNAKIAITQSENSMTTSISQSNNQAAIASSTNQAFVGIAGKIQAPQANVTTTTTTNNSDSSNRSTTTNNSDSSNRSTTTTNNSDSSNRSTTNTDSSNRSTTTTTTTDSSNRPTTTNNNSNNTGTSGP